MQELRKDDLEGMKLLVLLFWPLQELDDRCEELLLEDYLEDIDFDVEDALEKLLRLGIVSKVS